ncbi:hypothetical protein PAXRUDRAFT_139503 [Paxillus rubicundulus Ve08.2h10]|uniref:Uncharacterized protein n=1 Tax=Paxillus rubicundulus Ve08.2h10 TaxID=930991 RepID=A0A0D0DEN2_9AGAM|nr:hypothetical protein PAXRUDRAFT_139503 [Paxillus rubicundulus Ve08.2h10]
MAANCSSWTWIHNQQGMSPCQTAQLVGQVCNSQYTVSANGFQETQYIPTNTTANACTCSWAGYNLLSACTVCLVQAQLASWSTWATTCGNYVSTTTYLPSVLPTGEGIPYFAGTDPRTWTNEIFNVTEASTKGGGSRYFPLDADLTDHVSFPQADLTGAPPTTPTSSSSSSKPSVGAIAGGVLGGLVIIMVLVGLALFLRALRRRQASKGSFDGFITTTVNGAQFFSVPTAPPPRGASGRVQPVSFPYPQDQNTTSRRPLSPYRSSHGHSAAGINITSLAPATSSAFTAPMSPPITDAADMISPFYATSRTRTENDRNTRTGKGNEARTERALSPPGQRARLNPPPYSPTAPPVNQPSRKQTFKRKGSTAGGTTRPAHAASAPATSRAPRMAPAESADSGGV